MGDTDNGKQTCDFKDSSEEYQFIESSEPHSPVPSQDPTNMLMISFNDQLIDRKPEVTVDIQKTHHIKHCPSSAVLQEIGDNGSQSSVSVATSEGSEILGLSESPLPSQEQVDVLMTSFSDHKANENAEAAMDNSKINILKHCPTSAVHQEGDNESQSSVSVATSECSEILGLSESPLSSRDQVDLLMTSYNDHKANDNAEAAMDISKFTKLKNQSSCFATRGETHHNASFQKALSSITSPKKPSRMSTAEKLYLCDICGNKFSLRSNLKKHRLLHTGDKNFKCDICEKTFSRADNLKQHTMVHNIEKTHKCDICQKLFSRPGDLKKHILVHIGEKDYKCDVCLKKFSYNHTLRKHMILHKGEKNHKCHICRKTFSRSDYLRIHLAMHNEPNRPKKFACNLCDKAYSCSSGLTLHLQIHSGERNHVCNFCDKAFFRTSDLKKHLLIHTGEKLHTCEICHRAFTAIGNLKSHLLVHTGEKNFKCSVCDKAFSANNYLKKHFRVHYREGKIIPGELVVPDDLEGLESANIQDVA